MMLLPAACIISESSLMSYAWYADLLRYVDLLAKLFVQFFYA